MLIYRGPWLNGLQWNPEETPAVPVKLAAPAFAHQKKVFIGLCIVSQSIRVRFSLKSRLAYKTVGIVMQLATWLTAKCAAMGKVRVPLSG